MAPQLKDPWARRWVRTQSKRQRGSISTWVFPLNVSSIDFPSTNTGDTTTCCTELTTERPGDTRQTSPELTDSRAPLPDSALLSLHLVPTWPPRSFSLRRRTTITTRARALHVWIHIYVIRRGGDRWTRGLNGNGGWEGAGGHIVVLLIWCDMITKVNTEELKR